MYTMTEAVDILEGRAARYGGDLKDILSITPQELWDNPAELIEFWDNKDLSHILPKSIYPEYANDWSNIVPEDSDLNRARGAEIMTDAEISAADIDAQLDATQIDVFIAGDSVENLEILMDAVV